MANPANTHNVAVPKDLAPTAGVAPGKKIAEAEYQSKLEGGTPTGTAFFRTIRFQDVQRIFIMKRFLLPAFGGRRRRRLSAVLPSRRLLPLRRRTAWVSHRFRRTADMLRSGLRFANSTSQARSCRLRRIRTTRRIRSSRCTAWGWGCGPSISRTIAAMAGRTNRSGTVSRYRSAPHFGLLSAHRIDGAEQYFTRAIDYGYSFDPEEVISKWGKERHRRRLRAPDPDDPPRHRPDHEIQGRGGDRAHEATTILVRESVRAFRRSEKGIRNNSPKDCVHGSRRNSTFPPTPVSFRRAGPAVSGRRSRTAGAGHSG